METLHDWMDSRFAGNSIGQWFAALGTALAIVVALRVAKALVRRRLVGVAPRTHSKVDDVVVTLVERTTLLFMLAVGLWAARWVAELPKVWGVRLRLAVITIALIQAGFWAGAVVRFLTSRVGAPASNDAAASAQATGQAVLRFLGLTFIWIVVLLACLANLGINVTALVAGLGVGGIAVALAVQNILGDLFASMSLLLDRPFQVGDTIEVGDFVGTVEKIGVKTTRVKSVSGEQLIFANSDLLQSRVRNYHVMEERRVLAKFALELSTPLDKVAALPAVVREVVASMERTRFERAHLTKLSPSAFEFEVSFFVRSPDYLFFMDQQERFYLRLVARLQELKVALALPTHRVVSDGADPLAPRRASHVDP